MDDTPYVTSSEVVGLQSRLYSPGYAGPSRWVLFDAASRRAFAALGREGVPDVVRVLAAASTREGASSDDLAFCFRQDQDAAEEQLWRLQAAGLLAIGGGNESSRPTPEPNPDEDPCRLWLRLYHAASCDYPFLDYTDPGARPADAATMRRYASLWASPPPFAPREGRSFSLPHPELADATQRITGTAPNGPIGLDELGALLRVGLGPLRRFRAPDQETECINRTSPSGGARHPTECLVTVGAEAAPLLNVPPGAYWYAPDRHALIQVRQDERARYTWLGAGLALVLRSRVERAMWRYRDLRALRPTIIDVGHVAETLAILAASMTAEPLELIYPQIGTHVTDVSSLQEPDLLVLRLSVQPDRESMPAPNGADGHRREDGSFQGTSLITNPCAYLTFVHGSVFANVVWPSAERVRIDLDQVPLLSHCIRSGRGDRETTSDALQARFPSAIDDARLQVLVDRGVLLDHERGLPMYQIALNWSRYDWYLSLLAHLASRAGPTRARRYAGPSRVQDGCFNVETLVRRRTVRSFMNRAIEPTDTARLQDVVKDALASCRGIAAQWLYPDARASKAVTASQTDPGSAVDKEVLVSLTSGQDFVKNAPLALLLVADSNSQDDYEESLVSLGRIGQRACWAASSLGLGSFMTPALRDSDARDIMQTDPESRRGAIPYLIVFGYRMAA